MATTAIILFYFEKKKKKHYLLNDLLICCFSWQDLSKLPDSTSNMAGYMEPVKTFGSSHEEQQHVDKPVEQWVFFMVLII